VLRGALRSSAVFGRIGARAWRGPERPAHRSIDVGRALERALFLGRCIGGAIIVVLGPPAVSTADERLFYVFGAYFIAYALLMLWVSERAATPEARRRAGWLAHVFDTGGFVGGLVLSATASAWQVTNAAPLYIVIAAFRFGRLGAFSAVTAISGAHVALALWRVDLLGIPFDLANTLTHIGIYVLAGVITSGIESELGALRESRERQIAVYEPLLQAHDDMAQGVLITEGERAVYASDGLLALTGFTRDEVLGLPSVYELIPEDERESAREMTRGLPAEGGVVQKTLRRKDGQRVEVEVALRRYRVQGRERTVAILRDITIRTRALVELERAQRLESLGSLAGGIAHDFNNLLAVILNNAHLALTAPDSAPSRREMEEIREAAERGTQLTRQMLVFSRGGTPRGDLVDIRREIAYAERLLRRTIGTDVALDVRVSPELPSVRLEAGQLEQVLMNLAVNARDAMPNGGRLSVAVDAVELDAVAAQALLRVPAGRYVRVVVQDTGTGMTPEVAARAFEPFYTTKPKGRGTGLGLSTVYGIVRRAGGHVGLASTPGEGTRFAIHLPAAEASALEVEAAKPAADPAGRGETVLLVDDEESVRRVTAKLLASAGYRVLEAATPSEAIVAATRGVDLLVTDVLLPEIDGRELAKRLRESSPELPVVFVSGYAPGGPRSTPDLALLAKPFTPDALLARVREALRAPVGVS
jgi:two-component system cell cycle sensor histidine kinase/response regulator CckA